MPESDLDLLTNAARTAAEIALHHKSKGLEVHYKPDDAGPVTQADYAVDSMLRETLTQARPGYGWLSEETQDTDDRLGRDKVFIVDPIDGTRSFIGGERTWAHSLAVVDSGRVTEGVVYLPELDLLYTAAHAQGAFCNGVRLSVSDIETFQDARVLATKPNMDPKHWRETVPDFARAHRPSLAYRLCLVAQGRFDAMLTFRPSWEWDIAAGALILAEAGAVVTDRHGASLLFNNALPQTAGVIGAPDALHRQITKHLVYTP